MNIISTGDTYRIYTDAIKSYNQLPAKTYTVECGNTGFYLQETSNIEVTEKVFGCHQKKLEKVMKSFDSSERNLGVILSGDKGIGKSLFAKMLLQICVERGYPALIVSEFIPGISSFINSIEQEVFILFDEFDKTFGTRSEDRDGCRDPQTEMLSLFDGISQSKKMFIITCNNMNKLSDYLINRPGRFHYHFRFDYPDSIAIREFLLDKNIDEENINKVINFAARVKLNYDCLRAIATELQICDTFEEAISDLNIINVSNLTTYDVTFFFEDGLTARRRARLDMFDDTEDEVYVDVGGEHIGYLRFTPTEGVYSSTSGCYLFDNDNSVWTTYLDDLDEEDRKNWNKKALAFEGKDFLYATITHHNESIRYAV